MGQIIIPSDKKVKGPWLLDVKSLEDLNDRLVSIERKLEDAYSSVTLEATAERVHISRKTEKHVLVITQQGKKIKDDNLLSILKGSQINEFSPTELQIHIKKGNYEFALEVSSKMYGELETRIKVPDDGVFNDINYEISKWIDKYKPNLILQKWSSWFPWGAIGFFLGLFVVSSFLSKDRADIYAMQLSQETSQLLKDGLSEQEMPKAIEIILQKQSGYVPETFNPDVAAKNNLINSVLLFTGIALVVLFLKPHTVIGLGKNKWKVSFYRKWTYCVLVFVPLSIILPVIINKVF